MLKFVFWNVQHGSACFVTTPNKKNIVVDLGTGIYSGDQELSPIRILRANALLDEIQLLAITHPHADHIADILSLSGIPVRDLIAPSVPDDLLVPTTEASKPWLDAYKGLVASFRYELPFGLKTRETADWGGASVTPFFPCCRSSNLNDYSVVLLFEYSDTKLLMTGDNEEASWRSLLEDPEFVRAVKGTDIFVAPHHGRASGFYRPLFDVIKPRLTIVSDGPLQETSVTEQYAAVSSGLKVRTGNSKEQRKCVTSRCDGAVTVEFPETLFFKDIRVTIEAGSAKQDKRLVSLI